MSTHSYNDKGDDKRPEVYIEERPWGKFERFTLNEKSTVKIITVNPGEELSLQSHEHRSEFWRILDGVGIATLGKEEKEVKPGDEFFSKVGTKHTMRVETSASEPLRFLEIAYGEFDEEDIERFKDKYGRQEAG